MNRMPFLIIAPDAGDKAYLAGMLRPLAGSGVADGIQDGADVSFLQSAPPPERPCYICALIVHAPPRADAVRALCDLTQEGQQLAPCPVVLVGDAAHESDMRDGLYLGAQDYVLREGLSASALAAAIHKAKLAYTLRQDCARAQNELRQSGRLDALGRLTSGVVHDFNNLLTIVSSNAHVLARRLSGLGGDARYADMTEPLDAIQAAAQNGGVLVRQLLALGTPQAIKPQTININECIRETVALLRRTLGEGIEIETVFAPETGDVRLEPAGFSNVLINLAVNARDAMPHGGHLRIESKNVLVDETGVSMPDDLAAGSYVKVSVCDTGAGMPESVLKCAFDPFFTTKPAGRGNGLGLSQAQSYARQYGGALYASSREGAGSEFHLYLPCTSSYATGSVREAARAGDASADRAVRDKEEKHGRRHIGTAGSGGR